MNTLVIPFIFDRNEFDRRIKIELYEGMEAEIDSLLENAVPLLKPKAFFAENAVKTGKNGSGFLVGNQEWDDALIEGHFAGLDRVFPYIATCGTELEEMAASSGDMLEQYWFDALKQMALDRAFSFLRGVIKKRYAIDKLYSLNPGSSTCRDGWDLENQRKIFALLPGAEEAIGVRLKESLIMEPNKTVSGLFFKSDEDYVGCRDCPNVTCPNRRIIHDGAIIS